MLSLKECIIAAAAIISIYSAAYFFVIDRYSWVIVEQYSSGTRHDDHVYLCDKVKGECKRVWRN